jgi:hypothetical protein
MIEWQGSGEQRLRSWRQFRLTLTNLSPKNAIKAINHEWSYCPFVGKYLPPHDITQWPDPWTLLSEGKFCSLARALGMLYTISLCDQLSKYDIDINIYTNFSGERYDLVLVNDKDILNYVHDSVVSSAELEQGLNLQYHYTKIDLHTNDFR